MAGQDKLPITAKSEAPAKHKADAERALADRLAAIEIRLAEIGRPFDQDFPDHTALEPNAGVGRKGAGTAPRR